MRAPVGASEYSESIVPRLLAEKSITPDAWLPVLGADGYHDIGYGDRLLHDAGIPSEMFASRGAYSVVAASDFNRARSLLLSDPKSRTFVATDVQLLAWLKRREASKGH